jgi:hypothetical protein
VQVLEQRDTEGAKESEEAEIELRHAVAVRFGTGFWEDVEMGIIELRTAGEGEGEGGGGGGGGDTSGERRVGGAGVQ